jgi:CheY-like chemotaxis protein
MSFQFLPFGLVVRAFLMAPFKHCARGSGWILPCLIGFLTFAALPAQPRTNGPPVTSQFETPLVLKYYQQDDIKELARENTERFRVRIPLPKAAFAGQTVSSSPSSPGLPGGGASTTAPEDSLADRVTSLAIKLLCVVVGVAGWVSIARRLDPEFAQNLSSWLPTWSLLPSAQPDRLVMLLAEEKSVLEFQAALAAGASAPGAGTPEESMVGDVAEASLLSSVAGRIRELHRLMQEAARGETPVSQRKSLLRALDETRCLKNLARPAELRPLSQVACAVEMLLKQLTEKASNITSSTLRTATLGVTLLEELCQPGLKPDMMSDPPLRLLVVDDETLSRYALSHSLKRGLTQPETAETGDAALSLAARHAYDLIILDVRMPGMDGFELCSKIHETILNRTTPVVFVTSLRDFDARANSILCGGRDLIAKPFLTFELTVKALTLVATERLRGRGRLADAMVDEINASAKAGPLPVVVPPSATKDAQAAPEVVPTHEPKRAIPIPAHISAGESPVPGPASAMASFFVHARAQIEMVRGLIELIWDVPDPRAQREMVTDLLLGVHLLAASAESCGQHSIALMASTLEGLLKKQHENKTNLSSSALEAVDTAATLIHDLCAKEPSPGLAIDPPIRALVVDDDPVALRAISGALQMRFSKPESATDGSGAMALAKEQPFDVIFLDVQMPDIDGFEVCSRIRETTANGRTPVIFLTSHDAPALRARSEICGGNDFLTKSSSGSELTLKALSFALRGRLQYADGAELSCAT